MELLDGSASASRLGSRERLAGQDLAGRGRRCCPRPGARSVQRLSDAVERRRPGHSYLQTSQGGVREAAVIACERLTGKPELSTWTDNAQPAPLRDPPGACRHKEP